MAKKPNKVPTITADRYQSSEPKQPVATPHDQRCYTANSHAATKQKTPQKAVKVEKKTPPKPSSQPKTKPSAAAGKPKPATHDLPGSRKVDPPAANRAPNKSETIIREADYVPNFVLVPRSEAINTKPAAKNDSGDTAWRKPDIPVVNANQRKTEEPKEFVLKDTGEDAPKLKLCKDCPSASTAKTSSGNATSDGQTDTPAPQPNYSPDDPEQKRFERGCMVLIGIGMLIFALVAYFHFFYPRR